MGLKYGQREDVGTSPLAWWPGGPESIANQVYLFCIAA